MFSHVNWQDGTTVEEYEKVYYKKNYQKDSGFLFGKADHSD